MSSDHVYVVSSRIHKPSASSQRLTYVKYLSVACEISAILIAVIDSEYFINVTCLIRDSFDLMALEKF